MGEFQLYEELGRGNYGAVKKVLHRPTNVIMAMKVCASLRDFYSSTCLTSPLAHILRLRFLQEIRLELEDSKLNAIIMELDILHRAVSPEIVEFYGAFFVESCVYYCMEYMDAGSLEQLEHGGVPEPVLARIAHAMVRGLRFLKDELQIMHRGTTIACCLATCHLSVCFLDVKPTNVLVNRKGEIKLCDFGVSGQLERSLAKTNIGCQSYMAVRVSSARIAHPRCSS
jgi:mitogen-activated protein kinase kinase